MAVYNKNDYYCNFSPRMQENLINCNFEYIDEQTHLSTSKKFYVYPKTYELQLFLGMFRVNNEKLSKDDKYLDCQICKLYNNGNLIPNIPFEEYGVVENKFTKLNIN